NGKIYYKGYEKYCNSKFSDGQLITMELNLDAGTLHFIVNGIQQPMYVQGINEPVKFWFELYKKDSSFAIVSIKKLKIPTIKPIANSKAAQW
ncbi:MAG: hypothetical protein EZS28_053558, partial [Streblomastix strix]